MYVAIYSGLILDGMCDEAVEALQLEKTAIDRGRANRISLTHDLDLDQ